MRPLFNESIDDFSVNSLKWRFCIRNGAIVPHNYPDTDDYGEPLLPMWVADMDFKAADPIQEAVRQRAANGIYGYATKSQSYLDAIQSWMLNRHQWRIEDDWIVPTPGIVPGIHFLVKRFTEPGDKILIQRPVYHPFTYAAINNDRIIANNALKLVDNRYQVDFDDLEEQVRDDRVKLALLCSPHNPVGRVWREEELTRFAEICQRHNVIIVADEIHADLTLPGYQFFAFGRLPSALRKNSIICTAPSKTFNLAGMMTANFIIEDPYLREQVQLELRSNGLYTMNPFGIVATEAAYTQGAAWLDSVLAHIAGNIEHLRSSLATHLPKIRCLPSEATYLSWVDFNALNIGPATLKEMVFSDARLYFDEGEIFGEEGAGFMRINLACSRETLNTALGRLKRVFGHY